MQQTTTQTMAGNDYATVADEGDIIRVPQYQGALEVTHVSDIMVGVEFADQDKKNNTRKSMMINEHSGNLYMVAGSTDKGKVETVEVLA